jgi:hypothetical protein
VALLAINQNGHALRGFIDLDLDVGGGEAGTGEKSYDNYGGARSSQTKTTHDGRTPCPDTSTNRIGDEHRALPAGL